MGTRSIAPRRLLSLLILGQLVVLYVLMRNNSWVYDDNYFFVRAGQEGFTWHWLTSVQFQHWDIAMNATYSLQHALLFFDYRWALVVMLGLLGGSIYLFERTLAMLIGSRWVTIALAVWFGFNILWIRPLQWWAAGVQYFPYTFFDLLCLYGFVRYHAGGSRRWLAISAGGLLAGLLFYEKPAFMLIYLVLLRALLMSRDLRPRVLLGSFWRERWIWAPYLAIVALWGAGYIHSKAYSGSSLGGVGVAQYVQYFRILWLQTLIPSMAGVTIPAANLNGAQTLFVVCAQLVVVATVVVSMARKRAAWRAWVFLAVILVLTGGLIARSRVSQFGVDIANDPRYLIDFAWLVPLAVCAAFSKNEVVSPRLTENAARLPLRVPRTLVAVASSAILLAYAVGSVASARDLEHNWAGPQARAWETRVRDGIAGLERKGVRPVVAENATPFEVMAEFVAPNNRLSRLLPLYVGPIQVDGPLDGRTLVSIHVDGTVHRAVLGATVDDGAMTALLRSRLVGFGPGGRVLRRGASECVTADASPVVVERRLARPPVAAAGTDYLRIAYQVWHDVGVGMFVDPGTGYPAGTDHSISFAANAHSSIAWLGVGAPRKLMFMVPPLTTMCISRMDVGALSDAD